MKVRAVRIDWAWRACLWSQVSRASLPQGNCSSRCWSASVSETKASTSALIHPAGLGGPAPQRLVWLRWCVECLPELVEELRRHSGRSGCRDDALGLLPGSIEHESADGLVAELGGKADAALALRVGAEFQTGGSGGHGNLVHSDVRLMYGTNRVTATQARRRWLRIRPAEVAVLP